MSQEAAARLNPSFYTKPTYNYLSDVMVASVQAMQLYGNTSPGAAARVNLIDVLHLTPRLSQWAKVDLGYTIWASDDSVSVTVTKDRIFMTKGIRVFEIQEGLPAETLYNAIQTAQELIVPAIKDASMTEEEQEEYFASRDANSEDLKLPARIRSLSTRYADSVLAEAADDSTLVKDGSPGQIAVDECGDPASPLYISKNDPAAKQYVGKVNKSAGLDVVQTKREFQYEDEAPEKAAPNDTLVMAALGRGTISRLKSLQGRILTIVDASPITDKAQRDAVKSLISKEFRRDMGGISSTRLLDDED